MLHMLLMSLVLNINTDEETKQGISFAKSRDLKLSNSARLSDLEAYIESGRISNPLTDPALIAI